MPPKPPGVAASQRRRAAFLLHRGSAQLTPADSFLAKHLLGRSAKHPLSLSLSTSPKENCLRCCRHWFFLFLPLVAAYAIHTLRLCRAAAHRLGDRSDICSCHLSLSASWPPHGPSKNEKRSRFVQSPPQKGSFRCAISAAGPPSVMELKPYTTACAQCRRCRGCTEVCACLVYCCCCFCSPWNRKPFMA